MTQHGQQIRRTGLFGFAGADIAFIVKT